MSSDGREERAGPSTGTVRFEASTVTGTETVAVSDVEATLPAGVVASVLAERLALPQNTPWALRDDTTSRYLEEDRPIGEQIGPDARLTVTPKAHLG